jgi:hypothetical protein
MKHHVNKTIILPGMVEKYGLLLYIKNMHYNVLTQVALENSDITVIM